MRPSDAGRNAARHRFQRCHSAGDSPSTVCAIVLRPVSFALSWTLAAFGEELFWRGYLMNRVADLFGRTQGSWVVSLVIVNIVFGLAHGYQGLTGWIEEGLAGIFLGLMDLRTGRNLSVPIIAHGVSDTIDMVLLYRGKMPGM